MPKLLFFRLCLLAQSCGSLAVPKGTAASTQIGIYCNFSFCEVTQPREVPGEVRVRSLPPSIPLLLLLPHRFIGTRLASKALGNSSSIPACDQQAVCSGQVH